MDTLLNVGLPLLGQLVLFLVYHYGLVRPGIAAASKSGPTSPAVPVDVPIALPVPSPATPGGFLGSHPLAAAILARVEARLGQWAETQVDQVLTAPAQTAPAAKAAA